MTVRCICCLVLLVAVLGLAGCGSDSEKPVTRRPSVVTTADAPVKPVSACSLLTQEEVAAILNESVEKPTDSATGPVSNCNWMTPSLHMVGILVRRAASREEAETVRERAHQQSKTLSGVEPKDVAGLGDSAYWAGGNINQLNVFKGNYWLIITASKGKTIENLGLAKAVAEKALARLG